MKLVLVCSIYLFASIPQSIRADGTNRPVAPPVPQAIKIADVFAKPMSQAEAEKKFRGKIVAGILNRPHGTWVAEGSGGVTVDLVVPKKPKWYAHPGEVVQVEVCGKITKIGFEQKHLTIECEPQDIRELAVE